MSKKCESVQRVPDKKLLAAIRNAVSMQEVARSLNIPYRTFIERAKRLNVYRPNPNPSGKKNISEARKRFLERHTRSLQEILEGKHPQTRGITFKHRLFEEGYKKEQCEECGQLPTWNGKPLTLELEHKNGDSTDHKLENLRILCLHCHSQTVTYRRKKSALKFDAEVAELGAEQRN